MCMFNKGHVFPIKDLGEAKWLLGMHIERNRTQGWVRLSQEAYVNVILQRFRMQVCKPARTPYSAPVLEQGKDETIKFPFRELIGHYMYLSNMTRPDICHAVGYLSRYVSCFNESHVISVKRIIRYLKGTSNFGICFRKNYGSDRIRLYSDSDFAGDLQDRKSTSGELILMNGGPVVLVF